DDMVFNLSAMADVATLGTSGAGTLTLSGTSGTFESTTFGLPGNSLTINLGGGDDTLTIDSLDPLFAAALTIEGQGGRDAVTFAQSVNTGGGSATVHAETISVSSGVTLNTGAGNIDLEGSDSQTGVFDDASAA